jgi:hypothetical protein
MVVCVSQDVILRHKICLQMHDEGFSRKLWRLTIDRGYKESHWSSMCLDMVKFACYVLYSYIINVVIA